MDTAIVLAVHLCSSTLLASNKRRKPRRGNERRFPDLVVVGRRKIVGKKRRYLPEKKHTLPAHPHCQPTQHVHRCFSGRSCALSPLEQLGEQCRPLYVRRKHVGSECRQRVADLCHDLLARGLTAVRSPCSSRTRQALILQPPAVHFVRLCAHPRAGPSKTLALPCTRRALSQH